MLDFKTPEISDRELASGILTTHCTDGCEYTFGNIFAWGKIYNTLLTFYEGFLITKSDYGEISYCFPVGDGDLKKCIKEIMHDASQNSSPLVFFGLNAEGTRTLDALFPGKFKFELSRGDFDYIYLAEYLANLPGKKYHSKRNHISAFLRENNWSYEEMNRNNIPECREMNAEWEKINSKKNPEDLKMEAQALDSAFTYFDELCLKGGVLRADGRVIAFTMGEKLSRDTFCIHFEKAFADIRGAYQMINSRFAQSLVPEYKYINREDDVDNENLRKAKLSYHPVRLLEKYIAVLSG